MKIGVTGYTGRVAKLIVEEIRSGNHEDIELAGASTRNIPAKDLGFLVTDDVKSLFEASDVVIDFTLPEATRRHIEIAVETGTPLVIGTTGLTEDDEETLRKATRDIPIVYAANMSIGVNMLLALVQQAAERLDAEWDIEIFEAHHKFKVDAPSGTALALGAAAATGRGVNLDNVVVKSREGHTGIRETGTIGFSVARGGDVVGEHDVIFYGEGERVKLSHIATDRALFARGALKAARWLHEQDPGLYAMRDVLGL